MRFEGFSEFWKEQQLGNIATFKKGKGISKNDISLEGRTECIRYGELYTHYTEVIEKVISKTDVDISLLILSEENDVIIPSSGETPIDIATASCVTKPGIALGGDLNIIKANTNGVFLSYYLNFKNKQKIASLAQGSSVVHLYSKQLSKLNLFIPSRNEQNKIASFLSQIDRRIQTQNEIIEDYKLFKKGMMQKLFKQEIRFRDNNGDSYPDWVEKKLGMVCKLQGGYAFKSGLFKKQGVPIIRISNISNNNNYIDSNNLVYYDNLEISENYILSEDDLIIAMSGATTGKSSIYNLKEKGFVNQRVGVFRPKNNLLNKFLIQFVFSNNFIKQLDGMLVAGAQPNISSKDIEGFKILLPSSQEQKKIASTLSAIDRKIELENELLEKFMSQKKYFLQNLFI